LALLGFVVRMDICVLCGYVHIRNALCSESSWREILDLVGEWAHAFCVRHLTTKICPPHCDYGIISAEVASRGDEYSHDVITTKAFRRFVSRVSHELRARL